ncbi:MAG TPA: glycoside hydrolase family 68 protein [Streptosporangiaceae bacterium]|nr:glycoside hydrolase family 68 protein [Streptosporangiaceae bacterium]
MCIDRARAAAGPAWWTRRHLELLAPTAATTAPPVRPQAPTAAPRVLPHDDVWDLWPIQEEDGSIVAVFGRELWMSLSAPALGHPEARHDHARLRLLAKRGDDWTDLGHVFPDGASPGSREWSGSAVRRRDGTVSVFYTAVGERGEPRPTFTQRVIEARPRLVADRGRIMLERGVEHRAVLRPDGRTYLPTDEITGTPGNIKAFRDPGWFRDPADGREYLLVAASVAWRERFAGAVALAGALAGGWTLLPPLLAADGITNEIERPHIVVHDSTYYLFFSTQRHSFRPNGCAPTGLYGFAAPAITGPYRPLNASGLVIGNPPAAPDQTYAWLVLPDLRVVSFLNYTWADGKDPRLANSDEARAGFGGSIAPILHLALDGTSAHVSGGGFSSTPGAAGKSPAG